MIFIRLSTVRIFHLYMATSEGEGEGGVCKSLLGMGPKKLLAKLFSIHLESSETYFDLVASKIVRKIMLLPNFVRRYILFRGIGGSAPHTLL